MKNLDIKMNISINDEGDSIINDLEVTTNKVLSWEPYIVQKSQPDGYLYFPKNTGFQKVIKKGENILIFCNKSKYNVYSHEEEIGRIGVPRSFFKENNIAYNDKLRIELLVDKNPLEMNIEKI